MKILQDTGRDQGGFWYSPLESILSAFIWATVGGIFVFVGLAMEKIAEWLDERFLAPPYKPFKWLEKYGWWTLMLGITIEIAVAGWSAIDEWRTRQIAIQSDPLNQKIVTLYGGIVMMVRGTSGLDATPLDTFGNRTACDLMLGDSRDKTNICSMSYSSLKYIVANSSGVMMTRWEIEFRDTGIRGYCPQDTELVRDATKWDSGQIITSFLPTNTRVEFGYIHIVANTTRIEYNIPTQIIQPIGSNWLIPKTISVYNIQIQ